VRSPVARSSLVALSLGHFFTAALVVTRTDLVMSATSVLANAVAQVLPVRSVRHPLGAPEVTISQYWHPRHHDDPAHRWLRGLVAAVDFAA